jgi:hypothetical protein
MRAARLELMVCQPACAQVYQDLCKKHPTFRERSENTELAVRPYSDPHFCACQLEHAI